VKAKANAESRLLLEQQRPRTASTIATRQNFIEPTTIGRRGDRWQLLVLVRIRLLVIDAVVVVVVAVDDIGIILVCAFTVVTKDNLDVTVSFSSWKRKKQRERR
jgi:hypothetical protein